jgi:hypothetical protein
MSEDDHKTQEHVEDLDVPTGESGEVKGGLLPAVHDIGSQKVRNVEIADKISPGSLKQFADGSV